MKYDYDFKDDLIQKLKMNEDFSGCEKLKEFLRAYQIVDDEKKKNLLKFIIYKLSANLKNSEIQYIDCDVTEKSIKVFKNAYIWLEDYEIVSQKETCSQKFELVKKGVNFRGDTMTSALIPLVRYFELKGINKKMYKDGFEDYILDNINSLTISKNVSDFLSNVHTIGNFIPVPRGFNLGRSNFGKWDSWDLTLQQIYKWYQDNEDLNEKINNKSLESLFYYSENKDECITYCVEWLRTFTSWKEFVNQNYLKSFLDVKGKPKLFFREHSLKKPLPQTIEESEEFFANVNICILKRGMEISKALGNEISVNENVKSSKIFQKLKFEISKLVFSWHDEKTIEDLKKHPMRNLDIILLFITKWIQILYSIILVILYVSMKNKESGIFSYGRTPTDLFDNTYFIFFILICLIVTVVVSYNKFLEETKWKFKWLLKVISYIGCYGMCISLIISAIYNTYFINNILNDVWVAIGYDESIIVYNIMMLLFFVVLAIEGGCILISVVSGFFIKNVRTTLFKVFLRIGELFLITFILIVATKFIDYWKSILTLGVVIIIGFVLIMLFSGEEDDNFVRILDKNNNEIGRIRKDDLFK